MKKLIIVLSILLPLFLKSQNCKYDKDEFDKFQKIRKIEKTVKVVKKFYRGNGYLDVEICKYGDYSFLRINTASLTSIIVGTSDKLVFLLEDDSTITLNTKQIYDSYYNGSRYLFSGTYEFLQGDFDKIKSKKVKSIRMYYNDVYKDFDINNKMQNEFLQVLKCF